MPPVYLDYVQPPDLIGLFGRTLYYLEFRSGRSPAGIRVGLVSMTASDLSASDDDCSSGIRSHAMSVRRVAMSVACDNDRLSDQSMPEE